MKSKTPGESFKDWPKYHPHHIYPTLKFVERLLISAVYRKIWKHSVSTAKLKRNETAYCEFYFKEIHARYYQRVVQGPQYVTTSRLIRNFLISKANENLRAVISALNPYNLTAFTNGIRSQIELNALINHFICDPTYHKEHLLFNEDRKRIKESEIEGKKTVKNINTLIEKIGDNPLPYATEYHNLSLLLHPNPSAIKFYAQALRDKNTGSLNLHQPKLKFFFDKTIEETNETANWFRENLWLLFAMLEHFLLLIDNLKNDFFINDKEEEQFKTLAQIILVSENESALLKAVKEAHKEGTSAEEAIKNFFNDKFPSPK